MMIMVFIITITKSNVQCLPSIAFWAKDITQRMATQRTVDELLCSKSWPPFEWTEAIRHQSTSSIVYKAVSNYKNLVATKQNSLATALDEINYKLQSDNPLYLAQAKFVSGTDFWYFYQNFKTTKRLCIWHRLLKL